MAEKLAHDLEWIADRSVRLYLRTVFVTGFRVSRQTSGAAPRPARHVRDLRDRVCAGAARPRPAACGCRRRSSIAAPTPRASHVDERVGIAARRLAIIDLTGGDQPIANEDGTVVVVQNGEIYNYRELMHELERAGHRFRTRCDTEVLVHGYEEWGRGLWERLRGMFAVAVWDARTRRLVLARDRFGIKPLYYRDVDGELSFASELDALPHGDVDLDALEAFLAFNCVPSPRSIFVDIRKLPPGHTLTWADGGDRARAVRADRARCAARHGEDEAELVEECRARLRDSVRAHLVADVPVGVMLSGGVDSGLLAALAAEESSEAGAHVLDRLRPRRRSTSSPARAPSRSATTRSTAS